MPVPLAGRRGRRSFLRVAFATGGMALLAACGREPETIVATPPPALPTRPPPLEVAPGPPEPTRAAAAPQVPAAQPTQAAAPTPTSAPVATPAPTPRPTLTPLPPPLGRAQYAGDAQHTGRRVRDPLLAERVPRRGELALLRPVRAGVEPQEHHRREPQQPGRGCRRIGDPDAQSRCGHGRHAAAPAIRRASDSS